MPDAPTGQCRACRRTYRLRGDGTIRSHYRGWDRCAGAWLPPVRKRPPKGEPMADHTAPDHAAAGRLESRFAESPHPLLTDADFADVRTVLRDHVALASEVKPCAVNCVTT